MIKPIKPNEIRQEIPDWVIKGANECIRKNFRALKRESRFTQDELIEFVLSCAPEGITEETLFKNGYLDIEPVYREVGWDVTYYKPPYYEVNSKATFTFKIPK